MLKRRHIARWRWQGLWSWGRGRFLRVSASPCECCTDETERLVWLLRNSDDYRVRARSAQSLGWLRDADGDGAL